jgi:hypothetical protein
VHRSRRSSRQVIDWFDYRVGGAPSGPTPFRGRPFRRTWRRHRPWLRRVVIGLALIAVALILANRRGRRSSWL